MKSFSDSNSYLFAVRPTICLVSLGVEKKQTFYLKISLCIAILVAIKYVLQTSHLSYKLMCMIFEEFVDIPM